MGKGCTVYAFLDCTQKTLLLVVTCACRIKLLHILQSSVETAEVIMLL